MREIKFRAWALLWHGPGYAMHYGVEKAYDTLGKMTDSQGQEILDYTWESFAEVLDEADQGKLFLMQYTGLHDKNGKEIYEGDWLEFIYAHEPGCACDHCWPCQVGEILGVKWVNDGWELLPPDSYLNGEGDREGFCEECSSRGGLYSLNHEMDIGFYTKVIGNIYENPDLLKEKV